MSLSALVTVPALSLAPTAEPPQREQETGAHWAGNAKVGGIAVSRLMNAVCYAIAGVSLMVLAAPLGGGQEVFGIVAGVGMVGYGTKILVTRTPYWMNSAVYLLVVVAVGWAATSLGR